MRAPIAIDQLPVGSLQGARVLIRINGSDLASALPTLSYLISAGAQAIVGSGAPGVDAGPLASDLRDMLGCQVLPLSGISAGEVLRSGHRIGPGGILLLPDLGSYPEEAANDPDFARQLGSLAEVYCNESFALAHLPLASTVGIVRFAHRAVAGFDMARGIARMEALVKKSAPPVAVIIGGADLQNKLTLVWHLCGKADWLFLGGAICFTFLKAKGLEVGAAPVDDRLVPVAREILKKAEDRTKIIFPADFMAVRRASPAVETAVATELLPGYLPMDIGHASRRIIETLLAQARTLFWDGPLGVWEIEPYGEGTRTVAQMVARQAGERLEGIICGESLISALRQFDLWTGPISGLGAPAQTVLPFLSGRALPGVEALRRTAAETNDGSRRLILAVDSTGSFELFRHATPLFESTAAEVYLLLVDSPEPEESPADSRPLKAATIFQEANALLARAGMRVRAHKVREGDDPALAVVEYARELRADLVAVPSRCIPGALRILSGDWSQKLVKRRRFPILLAKVPAG